MPTSVTTSYEYDASGNRTSKTVDGVETTYVYDAANQLQSETTGGVTTTYQYDGRGNLLSQTVGSDTTEYEWDTRNRLTQVTLPDASSESYAYDAQDRRVQKTAAAGVTAYVWDEENLLAERDGSGQLSAYYTNAPGTWGNLISQWRGGSTPVQPSARFNTVRFGASQFNQTSSSSGESSFYGFDLQGSTRHLSDESGGITDAYEYSGFGEELSVTGSTPNPYRYDGQWGYYSDDSKRLYVRARHYQPNQGRWMSRDPIGFGGGDWNLYRYVWNNPVRWSDPSGTISTEELKDFARQYCIDFKKYVRCYTKCMTGLPVKTAKDWLLLASAAARAGTIAQWAAKASPTPFEKFVVTQLLYAAQKYGGSSALARLATGAANAGAGWLAAALTAAFSSYCMGFCYGNA